MEKFDALDCTGRKTGRLISRDQAHDSGIWHGAFHCLIIHQRKGKGYALFQKRSHRKKIAPGKFDVSVGGHYSAGEDARIAGPREISEELGLKVKFEELLPIGRRVFVYCFTPGVTEYEFQDVFLLHKPVDGANVKLQPEEVDALLEMEVDAGIMLFTGQVQSIECDLRKNETRERHMVSTNDFVPCLDRYFLKLLVIAQRFFRGERELLFI